MALSLPEILDRIFIHLPSRLENSPRIEDDWRRDKTDLFSCSLVCREWKDEVRRHIFHTITYSFNCVHATVGHYWTIERALQKFIEFLRSSPDICRLVRRLNLICDMHAVDARVDWRDVYSIIELLQNVEWVMLHDVPLHSIILEPPALRFSISTWDLSGGHRSCFGEPSFVLAAVNMFTSIDRLFLDCGPWERPIDDPSHNLPPACPTIRDLTLEALEDSNCATVFYDALRRSGSLDGPLKIIQFAGYTREEVVEFFDFLWDAGKHLTELNLDIYFPLRGSRGEYLSFSSPARTVISDVMVRTPQATSGAGTRSTLIVAPTSRS